MRHGDPCAAGELKVTYLEPTPAESARLRLDRTGAKGGERVQAALQDRDVLDGYTAGPRQSVENPLGVGGTRLHDWAIPLAAFRAPHGLEGGTVDESTPVLESLTNIGATIMGRNMFGGHPGPR
jgi:hypothetical protein